MNETKIEILNFSQKHDEEIWNVLKSVLQAGISQFVPVNPYSVVYNNPYLCKQCRSRSDSLKKPSDQDLHCLSFSL